MEVKLAELERQLEASQAKLAELSMARLDMENEDGASGAAGSLADPARDDEEDEFEDPRLAVLEAELIDAKMQLASQVGGRMGGWLGAACGHGALLLL